MHEGAHLIVALALHAFKKINFMGIGIQIDIYRDRLTDTQHTSISAIIQNSKYT